MSTTPIFKILLDQADAKRLAFEAELLGVSPDMLAAEYVRAGLKGQHKLADIKRRIGLAAIEQLAAMGQEMRQAGFPAVDAVKIARESREELEQRPAF